MFYQYVGLKTYIKILVSFWCCFVLGLPAANASSLPAWDKGQYLATLFWQTANGLNMAQPGRHFSAQDTAVYGQAQVPLGSVWKLFVYAYLIENQIPENEYFCNSQRSNQGEEYCCLPGASINRDTALAQSCGVYFAPKRWSITQEKWTQWLANRSQVAPSWLQNISNMQAGTLVPVASLLNAIENFPELTQRKARNALLKVSLQDDFQTTLGILGTAIRFKTWSWFDQAVHASKGLPPSAIEANQINKAPRIGGAVGWLPNGRAFWWGAAGTSKTSLLQHSPWIAQTLELNQNALMPNAWKKEQACVRVRFFNAYPIKKVLVLLANKEQKQIAPAGVLSSQNYQIFFENGQVMLIKGSSDLSLFYAQAGQQQPVLEGRFFLEDYVARVVEREGQVSQSTASQALAVLARTWLVQNSPINKGCYVTIDDSKAQRVQASPPTKAAMQAALWTQDLLMTGQAVRYHQNTQKSAVFSWQSAVEYSKQNPKASFYALLLKTYPQLGFSGIYFELDCAPLPQAQLWLQNNVKKWRSTLTQVNGFQEPASFNVCQIQNGLANSDQRRLKIYIQGWGKLEHRLSLIHEYLHLAFANHPNGHDEVLIEKLARQLAGV